MLDTTLRQPTKYDRMLALLIAFASGLNTTQRAVIAKVYDAWNTLEGAQMLNIVSVLHPSGPAQQAAEVIAYYVEKGPLPSWWDDPGVPWKHRVTWQELSTLYPPQQRPEPLT